MKVMSNKQKVEEILNCKNCRIQLKAGSVKCPPECSNFKDLMQMAEWKELQMVDKAVGWLKENKNKYIRIKSMKTFVDDKLIEDFKQAMKG